MITSSPLTEDEDRYLRLTDLARYAGLSVRMLHRAMAAKLDPLPAFRVGRIVLVKKSDYDAWLRRRQDATRTAPDRLAHLSEEDRRMALAIAGYPVGRR